MRHPAFLPHYRDGKHKPRFCSVCKRRHRRGNDATMCTACDPDFAQGSWRKMENRTKLYRTSNVKSAEPERVPIKRCKKCSDLPHRRPVNGCACGRAYAEAR